MQQRRRHIRGVTVQRPLDRIAVRDVARGPIEIDRQQPAPTITARDKHEPVSRHRRGDSVECDAFTLPHQSTGGEGVASHPVGRACHDLRAALVVDDQRRRPGRDLVTVDPPSCFAGPFIESRDKGLPLVVPVDHDGVTRQDGGRPLSELHPDVEVAQVSVPEEPPIVAIAIETGRPKRRAHLLRVGDPRR